MSAYLQLGGAVFFNVAAYLVYRSAADTAPRIFSFALITLAAALAFGERLSPIHLIGIGLVMTGIVLVTRGT